MILLFRRSSINAFRISFSKVSFSPCWAFCRLLWLFDLNRLLFAQYQLLSHSWQQYFHWIDTWRVYRDRPRVDMWNILGPVSAATIQLNPAIKRDFSMGLKAKFNIVVGKAVLFANKMFFLCTCWNKKAVCWILCIAAGNKLQQYSGHLIVEWVCEQNILINKFLLLFV